MLFLSGPGGRGLAGLGNPGTILGRHLSPRFLNLPGEGGQGWGTQTPGRGCQVPGARLVWPRGLEGRPTGHGVALARAMSSSWPAGNRTTGMKDWGAQSRTLLREGSLTPGQPPLWPRMLQPLLEPPRPCHRPGAPASVDSPPNHREGQLHRVYACSAP